MLELFDESVAPHYMMGRKPGMFPSFSDAYAEGEGYPHPVPFDLFDPFGSLRKMMDTEEKRARGRLVEINNGRAAMLGIFGFMVRGRRPDVELVARRAVAVREFDLVVEALQHRDRAAERQHRVAPGAGEVLEALDHMIRAPVRDVLEVLLLVLDGHIKTEVLSPGAAFQGRAVLLLQGLQVRRHDGQPPLCQRDLNIHLCFA